MPDYIDLSFANESIVSKRLKKLRKEFGYSFQDLQDLTQISRSTWYRYEKDNYKNLTMEELYNLSNIYKVSIEYITGNSPRNLSNKELEPLNYYLGRFGYDIYWSWSSDNEEKYEYTIDYIGRPYPEDFIPISVTEKFIKELNNEITTYIKFKIMNLLENNKKK